MHSNRRRLVCSDIHGCYETFRSTFESIIKPTKDDAVYLLGDYINKGSASKETLDYLLKLKREARNIHLLMGNHEQMLLDAFYDKKIEKAWLAKGGSSTLESFGVNSIHDIPKSYIEFIKTFDYYHELEDCFLVHAGFNFILDNPFLGNHDMVSIRDYAVDRQIVESKFIVHGHVPKTLKEIEGLVDTRSEKIGIDAGCVYSENAGMGNLVVLELNAMELFVHRNIDKQVLQMTKYE